MSAKQLHCFPFVLILFLIFNVKTTKAVEIEAVTKPSSDVVLSFVRPGKIDRVLVKEGDLVKEKQLLASLDDRAEKIQLLQLKAKAHDKTRLAASEAELRQKREDLKKIEWAKKEGAATDWELEHAALNVQIAELSLQLARFEHEQDIRKYEEAQAQIDRMNLASPITGRVEEVNIEPGESAKPLEPAIRVVRIDPLWIDVPVPLELVGQLKPGQLVKVKFRDTEIGREGKIIFVAGVAYAASDTLRIRVELANPEKRPAGERVAVILEDLGLSGQSEKQ